MLRIVLAALLAGGLGGVARSASPGAASPQAASPQAASPQAASPQAASPWAALPPGVIETPERAFSAALRQATGAPARADLGDQATVRLSGDLLIIPKEPAARLLNISNRAVPDGFVALLVGSDGMDVPGLVTSVPAGFVDSDAVTAWTADDLMASLRNTVELQNPERIQQGLQPLEPRRWVLPPSYDPAKHQLSWAAMIIPQSAPRGSDGEVTFHAIGFGRDGYIQLSALTSEQGAASVKRMVGSFLDGLTFQPGKAYGDTQPADRRSPGGLADAMGIMTLVKAQTVSSFWSSDRVMPVAGGVVAAIGALALAFKLHRQMRINSRRM